MYLTKLFVVLGVLLIATLGQTEGRRRWLHRDRNSRCGNVSTVAVTNEGAINLVQELRNETETTYHQRNRSHKLKCNGNTRGKGISNDATLTSTDSKINPDGIIEADSQDNLNPRINQRANSSGHRWKHNTNISKIVEVNATNDEVPPSDNEHGRITRRSKKCGGQTHFRRNCDMRNEDGRSDIKEADENVLNTENLPRTE